MTDHTYFSTVEKTGLIHKTGKPRKPVTPKSKPSTSILDPINWFQGDLRLANAVAFLGCAVVPLFCGVVFTAWVGATGRGEDSIIFPPFQKELRG